MSGGRRAIRTRSPGGVSPVRRATSGGWKAIPRRSAVRAIPTSGARRFLSTSKASARSGET
jgi:hypothetical protein